MSYFVALRQRIKTIQSIKKTTSAMRLIAMSLQSRLKKREQTLQIYRQSVEEITAHALEQTHSSMAGCCVGKENLPTLLLLIGSQKGLCGIFNTALFSYAAKRIPLLTFQEIITVGLMASKYALAHYQTPLAQYDLFSHANFTTVARNITDLLYQHKAARVIILTNRSRSFFIQEPTEYTITVVHSSTDEQSRQESPTKARAYLNRLQLRGKIMHILYESLLAEQSARFLSMDAATRNAEEALLHAQREYNTARQARVTQELLELTIGSHESLQNNVY